MEEKERFANYTTAKLNEFRKSIGKMGTEVPNGTIILDNDGKVRFGRAIDSTTLKLEDIIKTPMSDEKTWRKFSRIFYQDSMYRRILDYLASIFYNEYFISPLTVDSKFGNRKKLIKDYNIALKTLDEDMQVEKFTGEVLLNLLKEGQAYYYIESYKKGKEECFKAIQMPTDYCKIIGTAGSPAVNIYAINLLFIDEQMTKYVDKNILTEDEVLRQYPKAIRQAYEKFRKGKQDKRGTNPEWFIVPVTNGAAFTTSDGLPPLAYILELLARIKKLEPMRDDYIATNMTKLLVQLIDIDKEGNPEIDLELAADFHKNLKGVAAKKHEMVDALTTLAKDVKVLTLGETGDATDSYEFLKTYFEQAYTEAGVSSELFNSTTSGSLAESIAKDEKFMHDLRIQIEVWFNFFLRAICKNSIIKNTDFVFSYLDTSYKNREKMIGSYIQGAQYGFSKIVPQVALGVKQRYIESLNMFENDVLDLDAKLVPLQSSHTMSGKQQADSKSGNGQQTVTEDKEAQNNSDKQNGRPTQNEEDKKDSTITKDASL